MIRRPPRSTLFPYTTLFRSLYFVADMDAAIRVIRPGSQDAFILAGRPLEVTQRDGEGADARFRSVIFAALDRDRKSTRLNSSHGYISDAVFCLKKKKTNIDASTLTSSRLQPTMNTCLMANACELALWTEAVCRRDI